MGKVFMEEENLKRDKNDIFINSYGNGIYSICYFDKQRNKYRTIENELSFNKVTQILTEKFNFKKNEIKKKIRKV
jgi:hypothetical protein